MSHQARQVPIAGARNPIVDPYYRYTMPEMQLVPGKGNSTVITNMTKVAAALSRNPNEIVRFLSKSLAVAGSSKDGQALLKGYHSQKALQLPLAEYIGLCVLCPECGLPETTYDVYADTVLLECKACGESAEAAKGHGIARFIRKSKGEGKKKQNKKKAEEEGRTGTRSRVAKADGDAKAEIAWNAETDDAEALDLTIKTFRRYLRKIWRAGDVEGAVDELSNRQVAAILPASSRFVILIRAVLRQRTHKFWRKDLELMVPMLQKLIESSRMERIECEREILAALEKVCQSRPKMFPVLVLDLYNLDFVDEDTILSWADDVKSGKRSYPRDVVNEEKRQLLLEESTPLIDWLVESDEEENESDGD